MNKETNHEETEKNDVINREGSANFTPSFEILERVTLCEGQE